MRLPPDLFSLPPTGEPRAGGTERAGLNEGCELTRYNIGEVSIDKGDKRGGGLYAAGSVQKRSVGKKKKPKKKTQQKEEE